MKIICNGQAIWKICVDWHTKRQVLQENALDYNVSSSCLCYMLIKLPWPKNKGLIDNEILTENPNKSQKLTHDSWLQIDEN